MTEVEKFEQDNPVMFHRERVKFEASELIATALQATSMRQASLAKKLGVSRARVTHILDHGNITVSSLSDALVAMGMKLEMSMKPLGKTKLITCVDCHIALYDLAAKGKPPRCLDCLERFNSR